MAEKRNILFSITTLSSQAYTGKGGHYYSFYTIVNELAKFHNIFIVEIGFARSTVISEMNFPKYFINTKENNYKAISRTLDGIVAKHKVDVLHSFDKYSSYFLNKYSYSSNIPFVLTLCGGKEPAGIFPMVDNLVLFSKETLDFLGKKPTLKNAKIYLIPNRANAIPADEKRISDLKDAINYKDDEIIVMRIARIGVHHIESILETLAIANTLRQKNPALKIKTVLIGTVQSEDYLKELKAKLSPGDFLFTDDKFTINANQLFNLANIVVGSGRGVMEAAFLSKIIFVPNKKLGLAVRVKPDLFENMFNMNFSDRADLNITKEDVMADLENVARNYYSLDENIGSFNKRNFDEFFDVKKGMGKYNEIYKDIKRPKKSLTKLANINYLLFKEMIKQLKK